MRDLSGLMRFRQSGEILPWRVCSQVKCLKWIFATLSSELCAIVHIPIVAMAIGNSSWSWNLSLFFYSFIPLFCTRFRHFTITISIRMPSKRNRNAKKGGEGEEAPAGPSAPIPELPAPQAQTFGTGVIYDQPFDFTTTGEASKRIIIHKMRGSLHHC